MSRDAFEWFMLTAGQMRVFALGDEVLIDAWSEIFRLFSAIHT